MPQSDRLHVLPTLAILALFCAIPSQARSTVRFDASQMSGEQATSDVELSALPYELSPTQMAALRLEPTARASVKRQHPRPGFFLTRYNHPLTLQQVAMRDSLAGLALQHHQYVRVRLVDNTVVTGAVSDVGAQAFSLSTEAFGGFRRIEYRQLAEPPRRVPAVGTRLVHGLQITGMVTLAVVVAPIVLPLLFAGVLND